LDKIKSRKIPEKREGAQKRAPGLRKTKGWKKSGLETKKKGTETNQKFDIHLGGKKKGRPGRNSNRKKKETVLLAKKRGNLTEMILPQKG